MSFLDNLENDLKALEGREQGGLDESRRRDAERAETIAAAPWAQKLKSGEFAKTAMALATRAGFARRMKVNLAWIGTTLRFEAKGQKLELRPGALGVEAVFTGPDSGEARRARVDLDASPAPLIDEWMKILDRAAEEERARTPPITDEDET